MNIPDSQELPRSGIRPAIAQPLRVLDDTGLEAVQAASLEILEKTGIRIDHPDMCAMLKARGAKVDDQIVFMPASLVEDCLASAPAQVTLHARDPQKNVYLGEGNVHFTNEFGSTFVEDPDTYKIRSATLADLASFTRLADALERVDFVLFSVVPQDISPEYLDLESTAVVLQNTSKHVQLSLESNRWMNEVIGLAKAVVKPGDDLPISAGGVPNSPLHYTHDVVEKFMVLARHHIPCFVVCGAMAGATAPVTMAGALALQNAEVLAGIVIHQLAEPGAPVCYGTFSGGFDMRSTKLALGGPELSLIGAASQQLANRYHVPVGYATGGVSDSMTYDIQTGIEKTSSALFAAMAGVDVIHDGSSGLIGSGMLTSQRAMVIGNDLCNSIAFLLGGIPVTMESLAQEVIASAGPDGNFLDKDHTAHHFRNSLFMSPLRARNTTQEEISSTTQSIMLEKAAARAKKILEAHQPLSLTPEQRKAMEQICIQAKTENQKNISDIKR